MTLVLEQGIIDEGVRRKLEKMRRSRFDKRAQHKDHDPYSFLAQSGKCALLDRIIIIPPPATTLHTHYDSAAWSNLAHGPL